MLRTHALLPLLVAMGCVGGRGPIPTDLNASLDMASRFDLASTSPASGCGQQLGDTQVTFCETFDAPAGSGNRAGDLDSNVWSVARLSGSNLGQVTYNLWNPTLIDECDGTTPRVSAPQDVIICNGQLREAENDNNSGAFNAGGVVALAMSPKQPFDFAGRTGTVSFDVSNDSGGTHGAWPELWISDAPVPDAFSFNTLESVPENGLALRFASVAGRGSQGECPNGNNLEKNRFTVDSASAVRNYVLDDTRGVGPGQIQVQPVDCVIESIGPGQMNRIEVRINANQIDVYATDAGVVASKATLRHIAVITGANLTFTRGLVELVDAHNDGDMAQSSTRMSQREHTFSWDNIAFDGPFTYRDFGYESPDNNVAGPNGATNLGQLAAPGKASTWNVPGLPANAKAGVVSVTFNLDTGGGVDPTVLNVVLNGHAHSVPWPYPDEQTSPRTLAATVALTDLVAGMNVVQLGADQNTVFFNVDIVLGDVPGGVAILPGASRAYPN